MTRKNGRNTDGTFATGNGGKPQGARHKATLAAFALLDGGAIALTRQAVTMALGGTRPRCAYAWNASRPRARTPL